MQPKGFVLVPLVGALFFERAAYYAFRSSLFPRLYEAEVSPEGIRRLLTATMFVLAFGLVVGATMAVFVRSRILLAGALVVLAACHGIGAASPAAGAILVAFVAGAVRPLAMVAIAEELGSEGRTWRGVGAGAVVSVSANVAALVGAPLGMLASRGGAAPALGVGLAMLAVVCAAVVAFGFPGAPFTWAPPGATLVPGDGLYRAEPTVVRTGGAPSLAVLAVVGVGVAVSAWEESVRWNALAAAERLGRAADVADPLAAIVAAGALAAVAFVVAKTARLSPLVILGAGLVVLGVAAWLAAGGALTGSGGLHVAASSLAGAGDALFTSVALGYALGTTSSRFVGLVCTGMWLVLMAPSLYPVGRGSPEGAAVALGVLGIVCLGVGVASLVVGPRVERAGAGAPPA